MHVPASIFSEMFGGQVTAGSSLSTTVTVKLQVTSLPESSVKVYVIKLSPRPNCVDAATPPAPELIVAPVISYVNSNPGQLSTANNGSNSPALLAHVHTPASALIVTSSGHTNNGLESSTTSTVKVHVTSLPALSSAVYSISYVPVSNCDPKTGPPV